MATDETQTTIFGSANSAPSVVYAEPGGASMIQLRRTTKERYAIAYDQLLWCQLVADAESPTLYVLRLYFRDHKVVLEGMRLDTLFDAIVNREVAGIHVADLDAGLKDVQKEHAIVRTIRVITDHPL